MNKIRRIIAGIMAVTLTGMIFIPYNSNNIYAEESVVSENKQDQENDDPTGPEIKVSGNFKYCIDDDEVTIKGVVNDSYETVAIPEEIEEIKVTTIDRSAFENCTDIKKVILPDTIKTIMSRAFCCSGLTEINFPASVRKIDTEAFGGCKNLKAIDMSQTTDLKYIPVNAFSYCTSLSKIVFSEYVECIGEFAFGGCSSLTDIIFPNRVEAILPFAFGGCTAIKQLDLPEKMQCIYENAFDGCTGISKLVMPEQIEFVQKEAFNACTSIKDVVIRSLNINYDFMDFSDDITIYVYSNSAACRSAKKNKINYKLLDENEDDFRYTRSDDHITINSYEGENDSVEIPQTINGLPVTEINQNAFYSSDITQIVIPDSVKIIGANAFEGCDILESVKLPDGLSEIGAGVFLNCGKLHQIEIPSSVININSTAFIGCYNLEKINIPENVEKLGDNDKNIFDDCKSLTSITVDENNKYFCSVDGVLYSKDKTRLISYPCRKAQLTFEVPESVTEICDYAIANCIFLVNVKISGNCSTFASASPAISCCNRLVSVDIGRSEGSIDAYTFIDCPVLADIIASDDNKSYSSYNGMLLSKDQTKLFYYAPDYDSDECIVPASVKTVCDYSFYQTQKLRTLIFAEGVEKLENDAISKNFSIEKIILPDSMTKMSDRSFGGCDALKYIEFGKNIKDINMRSLSEFYPLLKDVVIKNADCYFTDICDMPENIPIKFNEDVTFHSYKNSSTEKYCSEHKLNFALISEDDVSKDAVLNDSVYKDNISEDDIMYGDLNGDKVVDITDLLMLSQYLLGDRKLDQKQMAAADVSYDGRVDILDLPKLQQYIMHDKVKLGK